MVLLTSKELCQFAAGGDTALVNRFFYTDLVLNVSLLKAGCGQFEYFGYNDIYCFKSHLIHTGNFFAFL